MNLFFDTETSGLPKKEHCWDVHYNEYPYILSMAWRYKDKSHYYLIHQEGRKVPAAATKVNNITTAMANNPDVTISFAEAYLRFIEHALECSNIVGHNIYFDISMFKANTLRHFGPLSKEGNRCLVALDKEKRIDTMRATIKLFGKWPKLIQLHEYLFNKGFNEQHDALEDVMATERCFNELKKRKLI